MNRKIALTCWKSSSCLDQQLSMLQSFHDEIMIFCTHGLLDVSRYSEYPIIEFDDTVTTLSKMKNFVTRQVMKASPDTEWLHQIEDHVKIDASPDKFIADIEYMMSILSMNSYLGTITDSQNYALNTFFENGTKPNYIKYNPKCVVLIPKEGLKIDRFVICSHANTQWIVENLKHGDENELYFNEEINVPSLAIVEFLARRKAAHKNSLYFMNSYFTCNSEFGVYSVVGRNSSDEAIVDVEAAKADKAKFDAMRLNVIPDASAEMILEKIFDVLNSRQQTASSSKE